MNLKSRSSHESIFREIGIRLRTLWVAKSLGTTIGMSLFFVAYFQVLKNPVFPVTVMPLTALDRLIAFRPEALALYLSLWFYVALAVALLKNRAELFSYGITAVALGAIGLGIFLRWPTTIPDLGPAWASGSAFSFLKTVDAAGNACPSLHVAFAMFSAIVLGRVLREMRARAVLRAVNWLWCLGIAYSTLAIAQHVVWDVVAGALLGALAAGPRCFWPAGFGKAPPG